MAWTIQQEGDRVFIVPERIRVEIEGKRLFSFYVVGSHTREHMNKVRSLVLHFINLDGDD